MKLSAHNRAALQALFVTFLWSTSWVFIKIGLEDIPALTFAGLRYTLAFLILLPFTMRQSQLTSLKQLSGRTWLLLITLGLLFYAVTQGAQFVGLFYLPAITVNLMLSFTAVLVAMLGMLTLRELPAPQQWAGMALYLVGAMLYFYPPVFPPGQIAGLVVVFVGVLANAISSVLGRELNRRLTIPVTVVTVVSMGIGALVLLAAGLVTQGFPKLSLTSWAIILWLAAVNSAYAFTLWNHTLRTLPAMESSLINNTMLIQIPILAWLFLGEEPGAREVIGLVLAGFGITIVQLRRKQADRVPGT